jgi:hypothetical protein
VMAAWGWTSVRESPKAPHRLAVSLLVGAGVAWGAMLCAWHAETLLKPDTRVEAAGFIRAHAAEGDTVAVFGRPYFCAPPVDADRFHVEIAAMSGEALMSLQPQWIVVSDYEFGPYVRLARRYPTESVLFRHLLDGRFKAGRFGYEPKVFSREPVLWGLQLTGRAIPHDLRYTCPTIAVFERFPETEEQTDRLGGPNAGT